MTAIKMQFFTIAAVITVGIGFTGFQTVHWFSYVPVALLIFAGITGVCPGLLLWKKIGFKDEKNNPVQKKYETSTTNEQISQFS